MFTIYYLLLIFIIKKNFFLNSNLMLPKVILRIKSSYNNFIHFSSNSFTVYKYTVVTPAGTVHQMGAFNTFRYYWHNVFAIHTFPNENKWYCGIICSYVKAFVVLCEEKEINIRPTKRNASNSNNITVILILILLSIKQNLKIIFYCGQI